MTTDMASAAIMDTPLWIAAGPMLLTNNLRFQQHRQTAEERFFIITEGQETEDISSSATPVDNW